MMSDLVVIEYTRSLAYDGNSQPQEKLVVSVRLTYEAYSSGWIRENFSGRGGPTDFLVMTAIANHARPLRGDDLRLLIDLGVATEADESQLYARVTDVGLADELGCGRDTVKSAAKRLAKRELIRICELPDNFRDSKGQFNGNKAYIISGIPNNYVSKALAQENDSGIYRAGLSSTVEGPEAHRAGSSSTVEGPGAHRAGLSSTVEGSEVHRAGLSSTVEGSEVHRAGLSSTVEGPESAPCGFSRHGSSSTNKEEDEREEDEEEDVFSFFLAAAAEAGQSRETPLGAIERVALRGLLDLGYSADDIEGIFARTISTTRCGDDITLDQCIRSVHRHWKKHQGTNARRAARTDGLILDAQTTAGTPGLAPDAGSIAGKSLPDATSRGANTRLEAPAAAFTDELAEVYTLLQAASIRGMEGVQDTVYDIPGVRLGLRRLLEVSDPFSPEEIRSAVLAAVSRSVSPDRLVGYAQAVLENARQERRETDEETSRTIGPSDQTLLFDTDVPDPPDGVHPHLWEQALGELELQMTRATFNTWLKPVALAAWTPANNGTPAQATLSVPNGYVEDWLQNRLYTPIQRTLAGIAGEEVDVAFVVEEADDVPV
jgi:hypothetical protein